MTTGTAGTTSDRICDGCGGLGLALEHHGLVRCDLCDGSGRRAQPVHQVNLSRVRPPRCPRGHGRMRIEPELLPDGSVECACTICGMRRYVHPAEVSPALNGAYA